MRREECFVGKKVLLGFHGYEVVGIEDDQITLEHKENGHVTTTTAHVESLYEYIPYERLMDLCSKMVEALVETDVYGAEEFFKDVCEMTEGEIRALGAEKCL